MIDCFNREVIGYAMADHLRTELVSDALDMAARNHRLADGAIFHSDHGCQYTSAEFAGKLAALQLRQSLGRTGICYDNAMAELFFGVLKNERVYRTVYPTRKRAREGITRYVEVFYKSRSSIIGDVSTRDSVTGRRMRSVPSIWTGSLQHEITQI